MDVRRAVTVALAVIGAVSAGVLVPGAVPAGADAGAELTYSVFSGPPGTTFELSSPDTFDMGVDLCPGPVGGDTPTGAYAVRWELAPLQSGGIALGGQFQVATATDPVGTPVAAGAVPTAAGVPWSAEVTVPDDVAPGTRLVVQATCTSVGPPADVRYDFYYLPVFLVTAPGTAPSATNVPPTTSSSTVPLVPTSTPQPPPAAPAPATARPGRPTFTG